LNNFGRLKKKKKKKTKELVKRRNSGCIALHFVWRASSMPFIAGHDGTGAH
jgi:hypothetical protein